MGKNPRFTTQIVGHEKLEIYSKAAGDAILGQVTVLNYFREIQNGATERRIMGYRACNCDKGRDAIATTDLVTPCLKGLE